ncbi:hypothetical protein FZEAL_9267 [Fusarium zealandicum]|uniref:BZIP domain-containing protein n=1 Tax=Fusarium zealandicum TaxID=1053134 RepID=A0A8H4UCJ7_9HYPO|nr:hypothetical protein FZEAL_9267 [Fusarium zealandicum]
MDYMVHEILASGTNDPAYNEPDCPTDSAKPPAKRRALTAARREQNRLAQSAYRKRRKEHGQKRREAPSRPDRERPLRPLLREASNTVGSIKGGPGRQKYVQESSEVLDLPPQDYHRLRIATGGRIEPTKQLLQTSLTETESHRTESTSAYLDDTVVSSTVEISPPGSTDQCQAENDFTIPSLVISVQPSTPGSSIAISPPKHHQNEHLKFPDLFMNMRQFLETTLCTAVLQNALSLGVDLERLGNCANEYMSPFYQPNISSVLDPAELLRSSAASATSPRNSNIPIHLRPTLAQVLIPHHVSLDLIPLPFLRERAIMLSAAMPHAFNTWELKVDIYERGGLTIWRHGQLEARGKSTRGSSSYHPWDMKSWEAAPWFLDKWSLAIGGEESEFHNQSIGWQVVREVIRSQASSR